MGVGADDEGVSQSGESPPVAATTTILNPVA